MWIELVTPLLVPVLIEPAADLVVPGTSCSAGAPIGGRRRRGLKPRALPRAIRAQPGQPAAVCTTVLVVVVPMTARAADHICSNRFCPKCFCLKRCTRRLLTELLPVTHFYRRQRTASLGGSRNNLSYVATTFRQAACVANALIHSTAKMLFSAKWESRFEFRPIRLRPGTQDNHRSTLF